MAMMGSTAWNGQDHALHQAPDEDFQQFLDMNTMGTLADGLQFDFSEFQNASGAAAHMMQAAQPREPMDTPMSGTDTPGILSRPPDGGMHGQMHAVTTGASHPSIPSTMVPPPTPTEAINEIDAQIQFLQQQRLQQQQRQLEEQNAAYFAARQSRIVPPTPQSMEMPPASQFYATPEQQTQQQVIFERYQRLKEQQDMAFTPLVSPAVTPLESQFPVDTQFTVPGAYFSPLTSPALHAQNEPTSVYDHRISTGNSPGEMEVEVLSAPMSGSAADLARKARKNNAVKARKANVRQSPISKPQRKKTSTPVMNAQALDQLAESLETQLQQQPQQQPQQHQQHQQQQLTSSQPQAPLSTSTMGTSDSENGSVSPENLTDMPPPPIPKPRSARPSPYIQPQNNAAAPGHITLPGQPSPATPASLMKLASPKAGKQNANGVQESGGSEHIENFELPESLNMTFQKPQLTPLNTKPAPAAVVVTSTPLAAPITTTITSSPSIEPSSAKAAGFQPLPSPVFAKPTAAASASQSPQLTPGSSASNPRKTPQMLPRGSKKRGSISSVHVSPALRPKISPNIKPLLPGGPNVEDQASRLLASKSNYQNILEGNTVPGVSYPSELSTNLTSKRTSHKIAEQGRRNRINSALQEIATLLPRPPPKESKGSSEGEGSDKKDRQGSIPNSKASTVELAIEYIKQLRQEVAEANKRAEEAEKRLEGLKDG